jgi:hypothetical protein
VAGQSDPSPLLFMLQSTSLAYHPSVLKKFELVYYSACPTPIPYTGTSPPDGVDN